MEHSDSESDRSRSRSPAGRRSPTSGDSSDEQLTPDSKKTMLLLQKVVKRELAPIKRNLTKNMDTTTQVKSTCEQLKRGLADVKMAQSSIDDHLRKAKKADPKKSMSNHVVSKMYVSVFDHFKLGKKKDALTADVFEELLDKGTIGAADEEAIKAVAAQEFSHLKSHLRAEVSKDLAAGNSEKFPKAAQYLLTHLKADMIPEDTKEFLTVMALGLVKFENMKNVPLTDKDKTNKKKIDDHVDNYWNWVKMKFDLFADRGESHGEKLRNTLLNCGYQKKNRAGAVRRPSDH